jgi:RHS repeat-associated protein
MYTYDKVNQQVSTTTDNKVTRYAYDAAGRLIKEGDKSYAYGWLDKVLSVTENGQQIASFNYHNDGQIAQAIHNGKSEDFLWDGLALIHRGETSFVNEPYVSGGNPILSSKDGVMFNDMLGSTLNIGGKAVNMTAFGESTDTNVMYTGKPYIGELGFAFLFRNYRSDYGKWQTTDPLGYPNGLNNLAYCNNILPNAVDPLVLSYDPAGLTASELLSLSRALDLWLVDFNTVFYPGVWWFDRTLTLSFVTRYKRKSGDQTLSTSLISSEQGYIAANKYAEQKIKEGNTDISPYSITVWNNSDLSTSLGKVLVYYNVEDKGNGTFLVNCEIRDDYDFHDKNKNVLFPYLSFEGSFVGWEGGDIVYDLWMKQLADAGYAKVFTTYIKWSFEVKE